MADAVAEYYEPIRSETHGGALFELHHAGPGLDGWESYQLRIEGEPVLWAQWPDETPGGFWDALVIPWVLRWRESARRERHSNRG